ncbi:MAG: hypothetical protein U0Q10_04425 [Dermatophilaceae bacterium]
MKRITGALAGAALAGSMGIGMATSASASTTAPESGVSATNSAVSCPVRYITRGIRVTCPASIPGTVFRAVVKCKRPSGATFMKKDVWRIQGTGYSQAQCPVGTKKVYYPYAFEYK